MGSRQAPRFSKFGFLRRQPNFVNIPALRALSGCQTSGVDVDRSSPMRGRDFRGVRDFNEVHSLPKLRLRRQSENPRLRLRLVAAVAGFAAVRHPVFQPDHPAHHLRLDVLMAGSEARGPSLQSLRQFQCHSSLPLAEDEAIARQRKLEAEKTSA